MCLLIVCVNKNGLGRVKEPPVLIFLAPGPSFCVSCPGLLLIWAPAERASGLEKGREESLLEELSRPNTFLLDR